MGTACSDCSAPPGCPPANSRPPLLGFAVPALRPIVRAPIPGWTDATVELVRDHSLHDLADVLTDQADGLIDDATFSAVVAAALRLRLLVLDEALQALADELHDGVDDALLLEVAVAAATMSIVTIAAMSIVAVAAALPMAAAVVVIVTIMAAVTIAVIMVVVPMVAIIPIVAVTAIGAIVGVAIVGAVTAAAAMLASAPVTAGARSDEPFERLQSFEDLTPIVVSHGNPPSCRLPCPARAMQAFSPLRRHPRKRDRDRQRAAPCAT